MLPANSTSSASRIMLTFCATLRPAVSITRRSRSQAWYSREATSSQVGILSPRMSVIRVSTRSVGFEEAMISESPRFGNVALRFEADQIRPAFGISFTAVTRVQIPSGTPNLFRSLRGTATFGAGTKRHNSVANFWPGLPNRGCFRASGAVLVGTKRHMQFSQIRRLQSQVRERGE